MKDVTNLLGKRKTDANLLQDRDKRRKIVAFTLEQLEEAGKQLYPELLFASCTMETVY